MNHVYFPWTLWPSKADHLLSDKSNQFSGKRKSVSFSYSSLVTAHGISNFRWKVPHEPQTLLYALGANLSTTGTTLKHLLNRTSTWHLIPSVALWMKSGISSPTAERPFCKALKFFFGMSLFLPVWDHSLFRIFYENDSVTILLFLRAWKEHLQSTARWIFKGQLALKACRKPSSYFHFWMKKRTHCWLQALQPIHRGNCHPTCIYCK